MLKTTKEIIKLIGKGHTQTEIHLMGYPWGTVRYNYNKLVNPKRHAKMLEKFRKYRKKKYIEEKKLSTPKK